MVKEFSSKYSYLEYLKNLFKVYSIALGLSIAASYRIYFEDWTYKNEIFWSVLFGFPLIIFIASIIHYHREKQVTYIFSSKSITIIKGDSKKEYLLSEITDVLRPKEKDVKRTGIDYIQFKFKNSQKIMFSNTLPNFQEIKIYIENYLKEELDYIIRQV